MRNVGEASARRTRQVDRMASVDVIRLTKPAAESNNVVILCPIIELGRKHKQASNRDLVHHVGFGC